MTQVKHQRNKLFAFTLLILAFLYGLAVPIILTGWFDQQWVPAETSSQELLWLGLIALVGEVGIVGIFLWKRWGIYLLFLSWLMTLTLNLIVPSVVATTISNVCVLFVFVFGFEIGRTWQEFE